MHAINTEGLNKLFFVLILIFHTIKKTTDMVKYKQQIIIGI